MHWRRKECQPCQILLTAQVVTGNLEEDTFSGMVGGKIMARGKNRGVMSQRQQV